MKACQAADVPALVLVSPSQLTLTHSPSSETQTTTSSSGWISSGWISSSTSHPSSSSTTSQASHDTEPPSLLQATAVAEQAVLQANRSRLSGTAWDPNRTYDLWSREPPQRESEAAGPKSQPEAHAQTGSDDGVEDTSGLVDQGEEQEQVEPSKVEGKLHTAVLRPGAVYGIAGCMDVLQQDKQQQQREGEVVNGMQQEMTHVANLLRAQVSTRP